MNANRLGPGIPVLMSLLSLAAFLVLLEGSALGPTTSGAGRPGFEFKANQGLDGIQPAISIMDSTGDESGDEDDGRGPRAACARRIRCLFEECRPRDTAKPFTRSRCVSA